jgi:hypothetical protein
MISSLKKVKKMSDKAIVSRVGLEDAAVGAQENSQLIYLRI